MRRTQLFFNWTRCSEVAIKVLTKQSDLDDKRNLSPSLPIQLKDATLLFEKNLSAAEKE
jgi:hypothetical protein